MQAPFFIILTIQIKQIFFLQVQADYYEVVADMLQTHFIFSIPLDGPPSFTTPYISLQWILRIEFVTTTRDVDWSRYEHPLLIEERERGEWTIPILVHAPLPRTEKSNVTRERPSPPRIPPLSLLSSSEKLVTQFLILLLQFSRDSIFVTLQSCDIFKKVNRDVIIVSFFMPSLPYKQ